MAKRGRKKRERLYRVQTGTFRWEGMASCFTEAIIAAFAKKLPERAGRLVRVHNGYVWEYIDATVAFKIAGYTLGVV